MLCEVIDANAHAPGDSRSTVDEMDQEGSGAGEFESNFPKVCILSFEVTGDLDCGLVSYSNFQVIPPDPHNFDGNHDGWDF